MRDGDGCFKKYETIAFLTQSDDRIRINFLEYKLPFGGEQSCGNQKPHQCRFNSQNNSQIDGCDSSFKADDEQLYLFYKSATTIQNPGLSYGSIQKAIFSKVKHKECKDHDYVLILQYHGNILIRSFYDLYHLNLDSKQIFKFPLIYMPSKKKKAPDNTFYLVKDGLSTKIERIYFGGKEMKDSPIQTVMELKTLNVFIFNFHRDYFYIMDDTCTLKQYELEKRNMKLKLIKNYEFAQEYRDLLSVPNTNFNEIQVTDRGIYKKELFIPFYDSATYNKDTSLIEAERIFDIAKPDDLFAGPRKLHGTQYMMYIAREQKVSEPKKSKHQNEDEEDEEEEDLDESGTESEEESSEEDKKSSQSQDKSQTKQKHQSIDENEAENVFDEHIALPKSSLPLNSQVNQKQNSNSLQDVYNKFKNKVKEQNELEDIKEDIADQYEEQKDPPLQSAMTLRKAATLRKVSKDKNSSTDLEVKKQEFTFTIKSKQREDTNHSKDLNRSTNSEKNKNSLIGVKHQKSKSVDKRQLLKKSTTRLVKELTSNNNSSMKKTINLQDIKLDINNEQVYAYIIPFVDSNVIHLTHNREENSNPLYQITFSSFLNNHDQILCQINQIFYLFSKNGSFLYEINVKIGDNNDSLYFLRNNYVLQHVSPNHQYFLFYNSHQENFQVFKLITIMGDFAKQQRITKRKKTVSIFNAIQQTRKQKQADFLTYQFMYIKTVKEKSFIYNFEDYLHQRTISNYGMVFQAVLQKKIDIQCENPSHNTARHQPKKSHVPLLNPIKERQPSRDKGGKTKTKRTMRRTKSLNQEKQTKEMYLNFGLNIELEKITNCFEFYIDDSLIGDFNIQFKLIKEHIESKNELYEFLNFGYSILGENLFIKRENKLEFTQVFNFDSLIEKEISEKGVHKTSEENVQKRNMDYIITTLQKGQSLNVKFDKDVQIFRIMETVRPDLVQIIASDEKYMYVITWDIVKNMEHSMIQLENKYKFSPGHIVCKGLSEKLNYIPINNGIYDLNYSLPYLIFNNIKINCYVQPTMQINERKYARFNNKYIDIYDNNKIYQSYTYLDLCYMKSLKKKGSDKIEAQHIFLDHLNFRIKGITFFHEFALNYHLLNHTLEEILKFEEIFLSMNASTHENDENRMDSKRILLLNLLYPNFFNNNAFDVAMIKKSPKSIEIMLDMLAELPAFSISKWIMPHFQELLTMQLKSFDEFLESCQFQQPNMREVRSLDWRYEEDELYLDYHTSYLGTFFFNKIQKNKIEDIQDDENEEEQETQNQVNIHQQVVLSEDVAQFELVDGKGSKYQEKDKSLKEKQGKVINMNEHDPNNINFQQLNEQQMKRVEFNAVEFDWVFKGKMAKEFIAHLAQTENDSLFSNATVKVIVLFLWTKFFYQIRNKIFLPFLFYFICFITMTTLTYEKVEFIKEVRSGKKYNQSEIEQMLDGRTGYTDKDLRMWQIATYVLLGMSFVGWLYFVSIEIFQIFNLKLTYFKQFWNFVDLTSICLNFCLFIFIIKEYNIDKGRVLSSVSIFLIYIKAFYFLRLFSGTAAFMRMIVQICLDIRVFTFIWFFAMIAFSNAIYILAQNLDFETQQAVSDSSILQAFMYLYQLGLGSFSTSTYNGNENQALWWIIFITQSLMIQIVFFNLLIAIMADTFDRVTSTRVESKLREICQLISEYEYCANRDQLFRNSKYIIVAQVEKAETSANQDWNGRLTALKNSFATQINELKREQKSLNDGLKEEIIANNKLIDQKYAEMQQQISRGLTYNATMVRKIDALSEKISYMRDGQKVDDSELIKQQASSPFRLNEGDTIGYENVKHQNVKDTTTIKNVAARSPSFKTNQKY